MKRVVQAVLGCMALATLCSCLAVHWSDSSKSASFSEERIVLEIALQNEEDHPLCSGMKRFRDLLEEKTDGRIVLDLHYSASLGDQITVIQKLQSGTIDGAILPAGIISDHGCESLKVFSLPYLFDSVSHARAFEKSESGQALLDSVQRSESRMVCIGTYQEGARNYFFRTKNVLAPSDMEGLVIRCQEGEIYRKVVEALGASARSMPFSELYGALQSGVIDGAEQPLSGFVINGYASICSYYVLDQHEISPNLILFSEATWNSFCKGDQQAIREAFSESVPYFEELSDQKDEEYYRQIMDAGVTVTTVDIQQWKDACRSIYDVDGVAFTDVIQQIQQTDYDK